MIFHLIRTQSEAIVLEQNFESDCLVESLVPAGARWRRLVEQIAGYSIQRAAQKVKRK